MSVAPRSRSRKVLIVDGDVRSSQRLASLLREDGFEVEVARDAAAARALLTCAPFPDTLITELSIPLGDGAALARHARSLVAGLHVVVLTRYVNSLKAASFGSPTPQVLGKPLEYARLLEALGQEPPQEEAPLRRASPGF
jgi:DNA-binding NtrC family response regulator